MSDEKYAHLPSTTGIYIDKFTDECTPFALTGWANFLAGVEEWEDLDQIAVEDGEVFAAHQVTFYYLACPRGADGLYQIPDCPEGLTYLAIAYGCGLGWAPEMIAGNSDAMFRRFLDADDVVSPEEEREDKRGELRRLLAEMGENPVEYVVAIGPDHPCRIRYRANPPRCEIVVPS